MQTISDTTTTRLEQEAQAEDRSLGEVLSDLATHSQALMRGELLRVKKETKESVRTHGMGLGLGAAAAVAAFAGTILAGHTIAWALTEVMPMWAAYLITTVLFMVVAAALAFKAKALLTARPVAPTKAIEDAKEDLQWIKDHK